MTSTRRGFFGALCAALSAPALAKLSPAEAVLYGDGIHDDTAGLTAWQAGKSVKWATGHDVGDIIRGEYLYISSELPVPAAKHRTLVYSFIDAGGPRLPYTERLRTAKSTFRFLV